MWKIKPKIRGFYKAQSKVTQGILGLLFLGCIMWEVSCAMQKFRLDDLCDAFCFQKYSWNNSGAKLSSVMGWSYSMDCENYF